MMRFWSMLPVIAAALHPRPLCPFNSTNGSASFARWLVHESDYGVVATHHTGPAPFGGIISIADGDGSESSTGIIYTFLPSIDSTYKDLMKNPNVSVTFSEWALEGGKSGGCVNATAENPPCGRVTITGQLTKVPTDKVDLAKKYLFATHPIMKEWEEAHMFEPFWMDPASITDFFIICTFGGAVPVTLKDYLDADWYKKTDSSKKISVNGQNGWVYTDATVV